MFGNQKSILDMLMLIGLLLAEAALAEPRTALVIGNAAYTDSLLTNPVNDARDIAKALQGMSFTVTLREDLQKRAMEEAISEFSRRLQQQHGVGLFFYAGHGAQVNGRNYLIPVGATIHSEADVAYEAVDAGRLLDHMEEAGNSLNVVILDACRSNPFGRGFQSTRSGGLARGLAQMDAPTGSLIAYSTAPGRVAEDGSGRNSPYTSALLAVMSTPGLSIEQVFKQVRNRVSQATNNRQVPWESTSLMGDFYFVVTQATTDQDTMATEKPTSAAPVQEQPAAAQLQEQPIITQPQESALSPPKKAITETQPVPVQEPPQAAQQQQKTDNSSEENFSVPAFPAEISISSDRLSPSVAAPPASPSVPSLKEPKSERNKSAVQPRKSLQSGGAASVKKESAAVRNKSSQKSRPRPSSSGGRSGNWKIIY